MKKLIVSLLILLAAFTTCHAQHNELGVFAVVASNPTTRVYINTDQQMISSDRSALGGGLEYHHWLKPHSAFGFDYEQNPSNGKLVYMVGFKDSLASIWPQMQYQALAMFEEQASLKRSLSLYIEGGAGANFTNGYSNSGWSHDPAFAEGTGIRYTVARHMKLVIGSRWIQVETGCYNGWACKQTWGTITKPRIGTAFSW